jgi:hypothetical protein
MNRACVSGLILSALIAPVASAQSEDTVLRPELAALEYLVGSCWHGVIPGSETFDIHCYSAMLDGKYVRDVHVVPQGATLYMGETIFHWSRENDVIYYRYFNTFGGISDGSAQADGDTLRFPDETHTMSDGSVQVFSSSWQRLGEDVYQAITLNVTNEVAEEMSSVRFDRITKQEAIEMVGEDLW